MQHGNFRESGRALIAYAAMILSIPAIAFYSLQPHPSELANGPRTKELMRHVAQISHRPHSLGTAEHDHVRDYIQQELKLLRVATEVQTATVTWDAGPLVRAADVQNIVGRLP